MPSTQEIANLRKEMGDKGALDTLYQTDPNLRNVVDKYRAAMTNMSPVAEAKFPTAMLNKHYQGTFATQKPVSPYTNQLANNAVNAVRANPAPVSPQGGSFLGETVKNITGSAFNYAKNLVGGIANVFNPDMEKNTLANAGRLAVGTGINAVESLTGNEQMFDNPFGSEDVANGMGQYITDRYGSLDKAAETLRTDPVGFLSDISTVVTGVGGAASAGLKAAGATKAAGIAGKVAKLGMNAEPAMIAANTVKGAAKVGKGIVSQVTGLAPETISTIKSNPKFPAAKKGEISRPSVGQKVFDAVKKRKAEVSETGSAYDGFRSGTQTAKIPKDLFRNELRTQGFAFDESGKLAPAQKQLNGPQLTDAELGELNKLLDKADTYGEVVTDNQFLRLRENLSATADFEKKTRTSNKLENIAKGLREKLNESSRGNLKGLEELDAKYSDDIDFLRLVEQDFIDPQTGALRDTALPRLANAGNKEGTQFLARLEKLVPDIRQEVNALKAMEDVTLSGGQKVGAYAKGVIGGAALTGGSPIGAIAGALLATPSISIPIIRGYGKMTGLIDSTINGILNKLRLGKKLSPEQAAILSAALQWAENNPE
jgi:hypothetical protein